MIIRDESNNAAVTDEKKENSDIALYLILGIVGLIMLPSLIIGYIIFFILFRQLRYKNSFNIPVIIILSVFILCIVFIFIPSTLLWKYIYATLVLGPIIGIVLCVSKSIELKKHPEIKLTIGPYYNFKYNENILDKLKRSKLKEELSNGELNSSEAIPLGTLIEPVELQNEKQYDKVEPVYLYYNDAYKGTFVSGSTGSGKSVTLLQMMENTAQSGYPMIVLDFKKGQNISYHLSRMAKKYNRKFYHFVNDVSKGPLAEYQSSYDPLAAKEGQTDLVLGMRTWDAASEVYKNRQISLLQCIFFLLNNLDEKDVPNFPWNEGGISQFVAALKISNLFDLIQAYARKIDTKNPDRNMELKLQSLQEVYNDLIAPKSLLKEQLDGLSVTMKNLTMSSYSSSLYKGSHGDNHIDLSKMCMDEDGPIVLFQFSPNSEPEFAKYMGSIIVSDIKRAFGYKESIDNKLPCGIFMDEFQTIDIDLIADIVAKVRSAKGFPVLSSQSILQLAANTDSNASYKIDAFIEVINNFIVHNGSSDNEAERFSKILGKTNKTIYKITEDGSGGFFKKRKQMVNKSDSLEYRIEPHKFQKLAAPTKANEYRAECYLIQKSTSEYQFAKLGYGIARKTLLTPNSDVLKNVPASFKKYYSDNKVSTTNIERQSPTITKMLPDDVDNNFKIEHFNEANETLDKQRNMTQKQIRKENTRPELETKKVETSFEKMYNNKGKNSKFRKKVR